MPKIPQKPRDLAPEDTYTAVCQGFIDLGTQAPKNPDWEPARKCEIIFELAGIKNKAGKPYIYAWRGTYSADARSTFMKVIAPWLGAKKGSELDTDDVKGRGASVTISHSDDGQFANISNIAPLSKTQKAPKSSIVPFSLYLEPDLFDKDVFDSLTDKQKEKIEASPEYQELMREKEPVKKAAAKKPAGKK